jgi:hydroxyacylglutathione hydrolase
MEAGAKTLYRSLQAFTSRPDWLQIWPGHGAGSACGKGISAIPQSTLGYERRFNWALQPMNEDQFVKNALSGQPEPPKYFAEMKRLNKEGPRILHGFKRPELVDVTVLERALNAGAMVVDTRLAAHFAAAHVPGTIGIPLTKSFTTYAGWLVPFTSDFYVIVDDRVPDAIDTVVRDLAMIGLDRVAGYFDAAVIDQWSAAGRPLQSVQQIEPRDLRESVSRGAVTVIDVRNQVEWDEGHIPGALHIPLGYVTDRIGEIPRSKPVVLQCQTGARSQIAASLLQAHGIENAINLKGGLVEWIRVTNNLTTSN